MLGRGGARCERNTSRRCEGLLLDALTGCFSTGIYVLEIVCDGNMGRNDCIR